VRSPHWRLPFRLIVLWRALFDRNLVMLITVSERAAGAGKGLTARRLDIIILTMIRSRKPDAKLRALKESGAVNPHAQDVRDDAFADSDFFDPRDLVQVRYEMLRRVRREGHSVAKAAALFGVSRPTFYKVQRDFDDRGLIGLLPNKRGPRGPHKIKPGVSRFLEEAIAAEPSLDAEELAARIAKRFDVAVHRRTVERALARFKKKRK
jgi:transposase